MSTEGEQLSLPVAKPKIPFTFGSLESIHEMLAVAGGVMVGIILSSTITSCVHVLLFPETSSI